MCQTAMGLVECVKQQWAWSNVSNSYGYGRMYQTAMGLVEGIKQQWAWSNQRENHESYPDNFIFPPKPSVIVGTALNFI
jgi:hypothetical protein